MPDTLPNGAAPVGFCPYLPPSPSQDLTGRAVMVPVACQGRNCAAYYACQVAPAEISAKLDELISAVDEQTERRSGG